jgi:hypothetical protein
MKKTTKYKKWVDRFEKQSKITLRHENITIVISASISEPNSKLNAAENRISDQ